MSSYLFRLEFAEFTEALMAGIPAHRAHIDKLMQDGILLSYCVSEKRDFTWCVVKAANELEAMDIIVSFPLYRFYIDVTCHPLLFHYNMAPTLPGISLN